jgi:DNA ligase D-like protein (predicted polymerase)
MASPFVELEVGERVVRVTNPDKVFFTTRRETKLDLVRYYISVADGIVRALYERPTYLKRHPDGAASEPIYQKRVPEKRPDWIQTTRVTFPSGRHADALCVTEVAQVAWAANLATLDFHPWPARRADLDHADELRIDIDPQKGRSFRDAKRVAALVHEVLDEIGYVGWPKTSGNRGIHIACRIEPLWTFPEVRRAALAFAREVERRAPKLVTTAWWKEERGRRVFIDYNQNARDRPGAPRRHRFRACHLGRATGRCHRGLHPCDDAGALRGGRRRPSRHRRLPLRPSGSPPVGGARRGGGPRRGAVSASLSEAARGAATRTALAGQTRTGRGEPDDAEVSLSSWRRCTSPKRRAQVTSGGPPSGGPPEVGAPSAAVRPYGGDAGPRPRG